MKTEHPTHALTILWRDTVLEHVHTTLEAPHVPGERMRYQVGPLTYVAELITPAAPLGRGSEPDWRLRRSFSIAFLTHAFFVLTALITPKSSGPNYDELIKRRGVFVLEIMKPAKEEPKAQAGGDKPKGKEGMIGSKALPPKLAAPSKPGAPRVDPDKRARDLALVRKTGLLAVLGAAGGAEAVANVLGRGGIDGGINEAMSQLYGSALSAGGGMDGLGSRGHDSGGGGRSLSIGGLSTGGPLRGDIVLGGGGKKKTRLLPGKTIVRGGLTKDEIGRVIRQNLPRFKHCYEKELNRAPNLAGKVAVGFTILPNGKVGEESVSETGLGDAAVEGCLLSVMRSLQFPSPRGGGIVVVRYPFIFSST